MKKIFMIISILQLIVLSSCQNQSAEHATEEEGHATKNSVSLTQQQIRAIGLQFGTIEQKLLKDLLKVNGELSVPNQNKAKATTLYPGVIQQIYVQSGDFVNKGQHIATLTNADYIKMQEDYLTLSTKGSLAETEYERQKQLYEGNAGALKNLQEAKAAYQSLNARTASLKRQLQMMGIDPSEIGNGNLVTTINVMAPVSGIVGNIAVQIGSYVDKSTSIAEIIDNRKIHVDLHVYEKDLASFEVGQDIDFYLTNNPKKKFTAEVYSTGSSFEQNSKTIIVHARVTGDKTGLIDGMNITAYIGFNGSKVDAVPSEAIVSYEGQQFILVADGEAIPTNKESGIGFIRIPVLLGKVDVGYTQITPIQAIPEKAKIVVKGAFFVWAEMTDSGEGHAH